MTTSEIDAKIQEHREAIKKLRKLKRLKEKTQAAELELK